MPDISGLGGNFALTGTGTAAAQRREPDEEFEVIDALDLKEVKLGRQGENNTQNVQIDCSDWLTDLPGCQLMVVARRPGESELYVPQISVAAGVVTWPILSQDTALAGWGRAEVRGLLNGKIKKSCVFRTRIEPSLDGDGSPNPPTPPDWATEVINSVAESTELVEQAEELVEEATATAIYAVRYDTNQSLTDAQKATARGNAGAASDDDLIELENTVNIALAGKADAAETEAALAGKVEISQGAAQAGKALVVGEDGNVTTGEAGIPEAVKEALLELLEHVAYIDDHGQSYYDALYMALYGETAWEFIINSIESGCWENTNDSIDYNPLVNSRAVVNPIVQLFRAGEYLVSLGGSGYQFGVQVFVNTTPEIKTVDASVSDEETTTRRIWSGSGTRVWSTTNPTLPSDWTTGAHVIKMNEDFYPTFNFRRNDNNTMTASDLTAIAGNFSVSRLSSWELRVDSVELGTRGPNCGNNVMEYTPISADRNIRAITNPFTQLCQPGKYVISLGDYDDTQTYLWALHIWYDVTPDVNEAACEISDEETAIHPIWTGSGKRMWNDVTNNIHSGLAILEMSVPFYPSFLFFKGSNRQGVFNAQDLANIRNNFSMRRVEE